MDRVRRSRELGVLRLGQPLKSFRDHMIDFTIYTKGAKHSYLESLGPLIKPSRVKELGELQMRDEARQVQEPNITPVVPYDTDRHSNLISLNPMGSTASIKNHQQPKDFISWFEIPVYNIERATAFYNSIYNMQMETNFNGEYAMAFFPADKGVGGALVAGPGCMPNDTGVLIYLNAGSDLDTVLGRVELAGGRVIMSKT